ncbi:MAG: OmpH family outer membrane protein [Planctomycetota bacterium]
MKKFVLGTFLMVLLVSCQSGGGKGGGVLVVDVGLVLQHSEAIARMKEEGPKKMAKVKEIEKELAALSEEARKTLDSIADKTSLPYREKEQFFRNRQSEIVSRARTATLNILTQEAEAYDKAYREVMDVALRLAKARGASAVLPLRELPKPSMLADEHDVSPYALMQAYLEQLSQRPVVAASTDADITNEVLQELGWAR